MLRDSGDGCLSRLGLLVETQTNTTLIYPVYLAVLALSASCILDVFFAL